MNDEDRWAKGLDAYASQFGLRPEEVFDVMQARFGAPMAREAINAAAGAWSANALSLRDRSLVVLAALAAQGVVEARLRPHVGWAIEHGCTRDELEAMGALLAVYVGYPRASVAMEVIRDELAAIDEVGETGQA